MGTEEDLRGALERVLLLHQRVEKDYGCQESVCECNPGDHLIEVCGHCDEDAPCLTEMAVYGEVIVMGGLVMEVFDPPKKIYLREKDEYPLEKTVLACGDVVLGIGKEGRLLWASSEKERPDWTGVLAHPNLRWVERGKENDAA